MSLSREATVLASVGLLCLAGCSTQPRIATGRTPDFYWSAASESWAGRDYAQTADHLEHLLDPGIYAARAIPWYLVITSGMARGYMELADRYDSGAHINKANALKFRREAAKNRTAAAKLA